MYTYRISNHINIFYAERTVVGVKEFPGNIAESNNRSMISLGKTPTNLEIFFYFNTNKKTSQV